MPTTNGSSSVPVARPPPRPPPRPPLPPTATAAPPWRRFPSPGSWRRRSAAGELPPPRQRRRRQRASHLPLSHVLVLVLRCPCPSLAAAHRQPARSHRRSRTCAAAVRRVVFCVTPDRQAVDIQPKPLIEPSRRSCHLFDLPAAAKSRPLASYRHPFLGGVTITHNRPRRPTILPHSPPYSLASALVLL